MFLITATNSNTGQGRMSQVRIEQNISKNVSLERVNPILRTQLNQPVTNTQTVKPVQSAVSRSRPVAVNLPTNLLPTNLPSSSNVNLSTDEWVYTCPVCAACFNEANDKERSMNVLVCHIVTQHEKRNFEEILTYLNNR